MNIPERQRPILEKLVLLKPNQLVELRAGLATVRLSLRPDQMTPSVINRVPSIPSDDVTAFVDLVVSLYAVREALDLSADEFVAGLAAGIRENAHPAISGKPMSELEEALRGLLSLENLQLESRAMELLYEQPNVFQSARILTDIRPIFGANVQEEPRSAVLNHTLKVSYRQGDRLRELFLALDSADLETLADVLTRARDKERSLWSLLDRAGVAHPSAEVEVAKPNSGG